MAGVTHLAIGLASKKVLPKISVWVLIFCAYLIDILFFIFMIVGLEDLETGSPAPWSHSLLMGIIWSLLAIIIFIKVFDDTKIGLMLGLLVFSHWIIDFISQPMTYVFPESGGPLLHPFGGAPDLGIGLWSTELNVLLGEFGTLIIGIIIYIITLQQMKREKEISQVGE